VDGFTVSYHTGGNWIITTPWGKKITFLREENVVCHGFPYIDMLSMDAIAMIQTICHSYKGFTKHKVKDTIAACKTQAMTGHPTDAQFVEMVRNNTIKKLPHQTCTHHQCPHHLWSKHRRSTVRRKSEQVEAELGHIPDDFHHLHRFMVMTADVMFMNSIAFLATLSQKFWLATIEQLLLCTAMQLSNSLIKLSGYMLALALLSVLS
jgi:hypothetical protein